MEFVGAGAVGLIFVGVVFLILVPVTARFRTHGKSKEVQRMELFQDYDARMDEFRQGSKKRRR